MRRLTDSPFWLILAVAAYILIPLDLIPDFIRPLGFLDDILILGLGVWHLLRMAKEAKSEKRESSDTRPTSPSMSAKAPHEVLGVSPDATDAEIEYAYKEQIKEYHPDRVHGLGKEIRDVAQRKTQELNIAYERLKKSLDN